jgi:hypothetical protein
MREERKEKKKTEPTYSYVYGGRDINYSKLYENKRNCSL